MWENELTAMNQILDLPEPEWWRQAVLLPDSGPRVVKLTGPDANDLLQRLTTNDMRHVSPEKTVVTALLSPTGRIRSVFSVVMGDDGYLLISGPGEAAALRTMLQKQIFFMDDVTVTDASDAWRVFQLTGHMADKAVETLGLDGSDWPDSTVRQTGSLRAWRLERLELPCVYLLCPASEAEAVEASLTTVGAQPLDPGSSYDLQRILAKRAGYGKELHEDYNPLEVGLDWICAENKGCYPGQEVIARQITYGKVTRQLMLLKLPRNVAEGAEVQVGTARVGHVSSVACPTPDAAGYGLAVLRSARVAGLKEVVVQGERAFICGSGGEGEASSAPA